MKIDLSRMAAARPGTPQRFVAEPRAARTRPARPARTKPARPARTRPPRSGRTVRLRVTGVSPGSVFRLWLIFAFLCLLAVLVGVFVLYVALSSMGAFHAIEKAINTGGIGHNFRFSLSWILWHVGLIGSVLVVLSAILAACAAAMFGAVAEATGGLEITVREVPEATRTGREDGQQHRHAA